MPLLVLTLNGLGNFVFWLQYWVGQDINYLTGWKMLRQKLDEQHIQIGDLLNKQILEEQVKRKELEEKINFYEKEFNINPLSWGKKKRRK